MKTYWIFVGFLLPISYLASAQEPVNTYPKVVIGQDGKLYINKNMGIYLWVSASPDEQSEKYRLFSDSSKKYSNPMYLDTEGINTVRTNTAVDTLSKRMVLPETDIIFEVYSDSKSPLSQANISGKYKVIKNKKYYSDSVLVDLKSTDYGSGIETIFYSVGETNFVAYKTPVKFSTEGEYSIKFYATDRVGNREDVKSLAISIKK